MVDNDYNFVNDALFLSTNIAMTRFPDQDVLEPAERFVVLERVGTADIRNLAALLYGDVASVEVAKVLS